MPIYEVHTQGWPARPDRVLPDEGEVYIPYADDTISRQALVAAGVLPQGSRTRPTVMANGDIDFIDIYLVPQVRVFGPCGACSPPGIAQRMNADENGEGGQTQTCDECGIYTSDAGAQAALRRMRSTIFWTTEHLGAEPRRRDRPWPGSKVEAYYKKGRIGFWVTVRSATNEILEDRFEWPLQDWPHTFGFNPLTRAPLNPRGDELARLLVALDQALERL